MAHPLLPLAIFLLVLGVFFGIAYVAFTIASDVAAKTAHKMEDKNIKFSKEGMKIGMKEMSFEKEDAAMQRFVHSTFYSWGSDSGGC